MPDMSGLGRLLYAALGGCAGALLIVPLAIASIWLDGLMAWAWVLPVAGLVAGLALGD
ncbi:MAG: hypothetical protein ABJG86_09745 [Nitratireductor sp.]